MHTLPFGMYHAFLLVSFGCNMRNRKRCGRTPTKGFSDDCAHVWKMRGIGKGRETVTSNHRIYFRLCSALHFRERKHSKRPPQKARDSCLRTRGTMMRRIISCCIRLLYKLTTIGLRGRTFQAHSENHDQDVVLKKTRRNLAGLPRWPLLSVNPVPDKRGKYIQGQL
jgi:hypothetical protein